MNSICLPFSQSVEDVEGFDVKWACFCKCGYCSAVRKGVIWAPPLTRLFTWSSGKPGRGHNTMKFSKICKQTGTASSSKHKITLFLLIWTISNHPQLQLLHWANMKMCLAFKMYTKIWEMSNLELCGCSLLTSLCLFKLTHRCWEQIYGINQVKIVNGLMSHVMVRYPGSGWKYSVFCNKTQINKQIHFITTAA